jgi:hypothetical protein
VRRKCFPGRLEALSGWPSDAGIAKLRSMPRCTENHRQCGHHQLATDLWYPAVIDSADSTLSVDFRAEFGRLLWYLDDDHLLILKGTIKNYGDQQKTSL